MTTGFYTSLDERVMLQINIAMPTLHPKPPKPGLRCDMLVSQQRKVMFEKYMYVIALQSIYKLYNRSTDRPPKAPF